MEGRKDVQISAVKSRAEMLIYYKKKTEMRKRIWFLSINQKMHMYLVQCLSLKGTHTSQNV